MTAMRFILRRLSTTATGRAIARETVVEGDALIVGRDPAHPIYLEDLAVLPDHVRLSSADGRRLSVTALGTLGFDHDGRRVTQTEFDAQTGGELRIGGHRLTVAPGENSAGSAIQITIERLDAISDSAADRDLSRAFSLRGLLPGRRLSAWGFALLMLAAFLVAPILAFQASRGLTERTDNFHADQSWSSGPLSSAHHSLARDCQSCHVEPFVAVRDTACVACHDDAHDHAAADRLSRARAEPDAFRAAQLRVAAAFNRPAGRCVDCHTEHEGAGPMPATAQRFCTDCHADMNTRLTDTQLPNAGDFGTAHPQFRPLVATAPAEREGLRPTFARIRWTPAITDRNGLVFPHGLHLSTTGGVAQMSRRLGTGRALECASCHQPTADGVRFQPVEMERDCGSCHSLAFETVGGVTRTLRHGEPEQVVADIYAYYRSTSPPRPINWGGNNNAPGRRRPGDFTLSTTQQRYTREVAVRPSRAAEAVRAVFSPDGLCADCHAITPPARGNAAWRVTPVHQQDRYLTGGWFDHGPHEQEQCSTCHDAAGSARATDLLIPGIAACRDCHGGEGSSSDVPSSCAMCHDYHAGPETAAPWQPNRRVPGRRGSGQRATVTSITDASTRRLYNSR